ncbi:hypothetical protein C4D60_Mb01t32290 [Musa balbisiana]|uniref:Uncharacterized protein n=1 Tax=Musa balbisiana TaxID=52838 RepID=A0A4S8JSA6_MUSBA|nr:hypothetical protein C4D60_Mb01t32290 [Musa balbisiana]
MAIAICGYRIMGLCHLRPASLGRALGLGRCGPWRLLAHSVFKSRFIMVVCRNDCFRENVNDIILQSIANLSGQLITLYTQLEVANIQLEMEKLYGLRRHWALLERLVITSSRNDEWAYPTSKVLVSSMEL